MNYRERLWAIYQKIGLNIINLKNNLNMKQQFSIFVISGIIMCLIGCNSKQCLRTPDLTMFELQGNVSFCRGTFSFYTEENGERKLQEDRFSMVVAYSEEGVLTQFWDKIFEEDKQGNIRQETDDYRLQRNGKGELVSIVLKRGQRTWSYEYGKDGGLAVSDYSSLDNKIHTVYEYDERGRVAKRINTTESTEIEETFDYQKEDDHGNWTERLIHMSNGINAIEKREITYWSDNVGELIFEEEIIPITPEPEEVVKYVPVQVEEDPEQAIFEVVEQMPEYPGGQAALMEFIAQNIQYPTAAKEAGTQGRVIVQFVVERDGSITGVKVVRSVGSYLDEEALRVMNSMPKWKPGMQRGKLVRVKFTVPVMFRL